MCALLWSYLYSFPGYQHHQSSWCRPLSSSFLIGLIVVMNIVQRCKFIASQCFKNWTCSSSGENRVVSVRLSSLMGSPDHPSPTEEPRLKKLWCNKPKMMDNIQNTGQAHCNILSSEDFKVNSSCEIWGFHSIVSEDLGLLRHGTMSLSERFPVFWRNVPSFSSAMGHSSWNSWPLKIQALHSFKMTETTHPVTIHHIPERHKSSFSTLSMYYFYI
jgi:hypothetical protein